MAAGSSILPCPESSSAGCVYVPALDSPSMGKEIPEVSRLVCVVVQEDVCEMELHS